MKRLMFTLWMVSLPGFLLANIAPVEIDTNTDIQLIGGVTIIERSLNDSVETQPKVTNSVKKKNVANKKTSEEKHKIYPAKFSKFSYYLKGTGDKKLNSRETTVRHALLEHYNNKSYKVHQILQYHLVVIPPNEKHDSFNYKIFHTNYWYKHKLFTRPPPQYNLLI